MKDLTGVVTDAGGGEVRVLVDRDTESYPPVGIRVSLRKVSSLPPMPGMDVGRCHAFIDDPWGEADCWLQEGHKGEHNWNGQGR